MHSYCKEVQSLCDDLGLDYKDCEALSSEILAAQTNENRQAKLVRMFVGTSDGQHYIRFSSVERPTRYGDLMFDSREDQVEYYNWVISICEFNHRMKVTRKQLLEEAAAHEMSWDDYDMEDDGWGF